MRVGIVVCCFVAGLVGGLGTSLAAEGYAKSRLLVEPGELAAKLGSFHVLDVRSREDYEKGHVPGGMWVSHDEWDKAFYEDEGKDREGWSQRIEALGIGSGKPIVIYDDNRSKDAARIWWILQYFGAKDVRLLNGGWTGWSSGEFAVSTEEPTVLKKSETTVLRVEPMMGRLRDLSKTLSAIKNGDGVQVVDARSFDEHCGVDGQKNERAGAIPGAKHLEWSDLIEKETARFKSAEEIRRLFDQAGIDPKRPTITHCQSGGRASVMAFGIELMGGDKVANYYRGWSEWGNTAETPVEVEPLEAAGE